MKWCKNGVVGIKIEIKGLKKPLITIVSAIEKHKVYKYFWILTKAYTLFNIYIIFSNSLHIKHHRSYTICTTNNGLTICIIPRFTAGTRRHRAHAAININPCSWAKSFRHFCTSFINKFITNLQ